MWHRILKTMAPKKESLPDFEVSEVLRYHVLFYGRVQGVGFRFEVYHMAFALGIVGWVRNLEDGSVEAELQGEKKKVDYLIEHMKTLRRAHVSKIIKEKQELIEGDLQFIMK